MKYLYGDSTEFQMQIDFLRLLNNFVETSVKTINLENAVFDLKETIMDRRRLKNSVIDEMDNFTLTVENAISGAVSRSKEQETIVKYAEKSKEFLKKFIDEGKTKFTDEIFQEIAQFEQKIEEADEGNRKTLESFFIYDPLPIIGTIYTIKAAENGFSARVQVDSEDNISCIFDIASSESPFWKGNVRVRDFVKGVEIPARMKKPFLKKELVPDIVNIDDFLLGDLILSDKELEVVFRKRPDTKAQRFRLKMNLKGEFSVDVSHAEENGVETGINAVPELKNELNILRLQELREKIVEKTNYLYPKKQKLKTILVEDRNVFEENLVYDLMQRVAHIFAPTVAEIKKRSPSNEELSLKSEDESGKRNEIYLKKSEVKEKLNAINEKGAKLLEILDVM
jgi:Mg2+ and Co2+ transporter CorA